MQDKMPTEIRVTVVNLNTGGRFVLTKIVKRDLPKRGRWMAYSPKIKRIRRIKGGKSSKK